MNYLELCRRARRECGIAGAETNPTAVTSQVGEYRRLVDWVSEAWTEIQGRHTDWRWLRRELTFNTTAGDGSYSYGDVTDVDAAAVISRFSHWWAHDEEMPFTIYLTSAGAAGERDLIYIPWENFRWHYRRGVHNNAPPVHISVDPQNRLVLGPTPDAIYTVKGTYQRGPQILAADGDTPEFGSQYHMLIVYRTMEKYSIFENAPEVYDGGKKAEGRLMAQLEAVELPEFRLAEPLA